MIITSLILLTIGLIFVFANEWISESLHKSNHSIGSSDFEDILAVFGFMILFFGIALFGYSIIHFKARYFTWIGLGIGIIVSFMHLHKCYLIFEESGKDKYSGGGSGMLLLGCLGLFVFPFIGYIAGYTIKTIII